MRPLADRNLLFGLWLGLLLVLPGARAAVGQGQVPTREITRRVELAPDGDRSAASLPPSLMQVRDGEGLIKAYYADVESVACEDEGCKVVIVRLFWDALGNYSRYELPSGGGLTKRGHKPFTSEDHEKLQAILSDPHSPLKWITKDQITLPKVVEADEAGLDAISAPTALSHTDAVVPGAAYTCYTLWHATYGKVNSLILEMTVAASDQRHLMQYLTCNNEAYVAFALEQLNERQIVQPDVVDAVIELTRRADATLLEPALNFLRMVSENSGSDVYFTAIEQLFTSADKKSRAVYLKSLRDQSLPAPAGYYDRISRWLPAMTTYQEVDLLLDLLIDRHASAQQVVRQAIPLLECDSFLAARRAYYFLEKQDLRETERKQVERFRERHKDRL